MILKSEHGNEEERVCVVLAIVMNHLIFLFVFIFFGARLINYGFIKL